MKFSEQLLILNCIYLQIVALFAMVAVAASAESESNAETLRSAQEVNEDSYNFSYETSNGITHEESGELKKFSPEEEAIVVQGKSGWTSPDGEKVFFEFVADQNGYQPQGSHIPVGPEVPPHIIRALEYLRTHAPAEN